MLDMVGVVVLCQGSGRCPDEMEQGGGEGGDVYKGDVPVAVNLRMAYQTGDGSARERVARRRHYQWCHQPWPRYVGRRAAS